MTAPTNTVTSATPNVGVREDLENVIYRVAPEETPFMSNIGTSKATNIYHEWQTETLATAVATNAQLEGDDYTLGAPNLTSRIGNYMQIVAKAGGVSRTQEVVDKAGRSSELARQKTLKTIEMKRDLEMRVIGNYASVAESGATTRKTPASWPSSPRTTLAVLAVRTAVSRPASSLRPPPERSARSPKPW